MQGFQGVQGSPNTNVGQVVIAKAKTTSTITHSGSPVTVDTISCSTGDLVFDSAFSDQAHLRPVSTSMTYWYSLMTAD